MKTSTLILALIFLSYHSATAQQASAGMQNAKIPETWDNPTDAPITTHVFKPAKKDATEERVKQLRVPAGFKVEKFAEDLGEARILAVSDAGHVYVTNREDSEIIMLEDSNNDGKADRRQVVANVEDAHGLAIHNNRLYIVNNMEIYAADIRENGTLGETEKLNTYQADGGQHPNRTIGFGPDNQMYISVGSTCNACPEPNPLHATMLQFNTDGKDMKIFAEGLRNTIGFGWHPETKAFWGMDHGIDLLGDDVSKEEFNLIEEGNHYGWPHIYEDGQYNPYPAPEDESYSEFKEKTTSPKLTYTAHAAPMQMAFYDKDQFPSEYRGDAFVAFRGSWNRSTPSGYKISRIVFENGEPARFEDFVTGFLIENDRAHFGRLVGLAIHPDGSLLFTDDTNGVIYKVSYR